MMTGTPLLSEAIFDEQDRYWWSMVTITRMLVLEGAWKWITLAYGVRSAAIVVATAAAFWWGTAIYQNYAWFTEVRGVPGGRVGE